MFDKRSDGSGVSQLHDKPFLFPDFSNAHPFA